MTKDPITIKMKLPRLGRDAGEVISTFDRGLCATLIAEGVAVEVAPAAKMTTPPENKMFKAGRIKNK